VPPYATIAVGKWDNSTDGVSPNPTWPTYCGFDRFYGFLEGETGYFFPARIVHNNIVAPIDEYPRAIMRPTIGWTRRSAL
jgi:arylsulfatase A-like enzyme